jgi:hypothetical protein
VETKTLSAVKRGSILALAMALVGSVLTLIISVTHVGASSALNGPIARAEVLSRAQNWVDRRLTYTQTGTWASDADGGHTYRRDCSGLVSMAWHLGSSLVTNQFLDKARNNDGMHVIARDDLMAGDAMVRDKDGWGPDGHIELFSHWVNAANHGQGAYVYSFNTTGETVQNPYAVSNFGKLGRNSDADMRTFTPIRYNGITASIPSAPAMDSVTGLGDYNGDRKQDVAALHDYGGGHVSLFVWYGGAQPVRAWDGPTWGSAAATKVVPGDFTGDGKSDVALFYDYGGGHVAIYVLPGTAGGTFGTAVRAWDAPSWGSGAATRLVPGDFTGDGKTDLSLFYDYGGGHVAIYVLPGTAGGTFGTAVRAWDAPSWGSGAATRLVPGDYTGDGKTDLSLFYDYGNGHVALFNLYATGTGAFDQVVRAWDGPTWGSGAATRVVPGDYNGDGRDDISLFYDYGNGHVAMFNLRGTTGTASGTFDPPVLAWDAPTWGSGSATRLMPGDYNGDASTDMAVFFDYGSGHVALFVLPGTLSMRFDAAVLAWDARTWGPGSATQLIAGDTTGDGRDDATLFFDYGSNHVALFTLPGAPTHTFGPAQRSWDGPTWGPSANTRLF